MAQKYLTNLDLNKNQLLNAIIQNLGAMPDEAIAGQIAFDTTVNKLKIFDGSTWQEVGKTLTPNQLVQMINQSEVLVDQEKVNGLKETIQSLTKKNETALEEAKAYINEVKTSIIGLASEEADTLKELEDLITNNKSAILTIQNTYKKFTQEIGDGESTSHLINHNLHTKDVVVELYLVENGEMVMANVVVNDNDNVTIKTSKPIPTNDKIRVVIIGHNGE